MPSQEYIKKYGHSRVRSSKEIQMPIETHKTKTPPELIEKPPHPDIIRITPVFRDHAALEQHSKLIWKFITTGR